MKKIMIGAIVLGVMSINVWGWTISGATIERILIAHNGTISMTVYDGTSRSTRSVNMGNTDAKKALLAAALTIKTSGGTADLSIGSGQITGLVANK